MSRLTDFSENFREARIPFPEAWNELHLQDVMCDGVIRSSDGCTFPVHRIIVCSAAEKISQLFIRETDSGVKEVVEVSFPVPANIVKLLLEYIYTGTCTLTVSKARSLLKVAHRYDVEELVRDCCCFLREEMRAKNCVDTLKAAADLHLVSLERQALRFICYNFLEVVESAAAIWTLGPDTMYEILSSDQLNVGHEKAVLDAAIRWAEHDPENRVAPLQNLITLCPRYGLLDPQEFDDIVLNNEYLRRSETLQKKLQSTCEHLKNIQRESAKKYFDFDVARPRIPYGIIFAIGGWSDGAPTNFMETYDSRTDRWYSSNFVDPLARAYHGICVLKKLIYLIGGHDGREYFNSVKCYDPEKHEWSDRACMYHARSYVSVCIAGQSKELDCGDKIYAIGGNDGRNRLNSVERYDPSLNQWTMLHDMQCARSDAGAATLNDKIYVAGGFNGTEVLDSVEIYDPETDSWTFIQELGVSRSGLKLIANKGCLYALGGFSGWHRLESAEMLDPEKSLGWSEICPMHYARSNFGAVVLDNRIYAIGGYDGFTTIPYVERYDIRDNRWDVVEKMGLHRSALAACVVSGLSNSYEYSFIKDENKVSEDGDRGSSKEPQTSGTACG
ncbi:kelch-like protein 10 [Schistocerca americana]|uniref:kelch-like protein 10 n=1 Tax=Schistocerca americana TaxID=7009 RepID=UPI001F4F246C|nr:kelch-like protein 10 [Schistocerca americana]